MGYITIQTGGSFPDAIKQFNANRKGHAHAVAEAIQYLSEVVLPESIERDHRLHEQGAKPKLGFGRE